MELLLNPDLLAVNSYYSQTEKFAGGRLWSGPPGKEIWGKPLAPGTAAVVLMNRGGLASGVALGKRNPYFAPCECQLFRRCLPLSSSSRVFLTEPQ